MYVLGWLGPGFQLGTDVRWILLHYFEEMPLGSMVEESEHPELSPEVVLGFERNILQIKAPI
jgi:hypothetical protein